MIDNNTFNKMSVGHKFYLLLLLLLVAMHFCNINIKIIKNHFTFVVVLCYIFFYSYIQL